MMELPGNAAGPNQQMLHRRTPVERWRIQLCILGADSLVTLAGTGLFQLDAKTCLRTK